MASTVGSDPEPSRGRASVTAAKHWAGYGWFMSFGTFLPLVIFLCSYVVHVTLVGAPIARMGNRFGIWVSTFGQEPPGKEKLEARASAKEKPPFAERVRRYSPAIFLERRGRPVSTPVRALWFVFVGWWLGAIWVLISWSVFLAPYPFLDTVATLLDELPTVMTLAYPDRLRT
jgi:uncharacterized membrane protein YccF (DUF307 family)